MTSSPCYIVITPVRDEEPYLPLTISSMVAQTVRPRQWILVDDGSRDRTGALIDEAAERHPWITAVHRGDRGSRQAGAGVIAAFNAGYRAVAVPDWEFIAKFDGDQSMPSDYFAGCLREFARDPSLGVGGGMCCTAGPGEQVPEANDPGFHVRGATKIYRRACFEAIGGLRQTTGWDTIDLIKANSLGWTTRTFPHLKVTLHRPTGAAYGAWPNFVKNGLANYITGYLPLFMALKCARRTLSRPHLQGLGLAYGFLKGYVTGTARVRDRAMIRYLRTQQWRALTFRSNLWHPSTPSPVLPAASKRTA